MENKTSNSTSVEDAVITILPVVLGVIGIPANSLAVLVVLTMQKLTPATFLIAALAVFDGLALLLKLTLTRLFIHKSLSDFACKFNFSTTFCTTMANWMLAIICAERFISLCYPLQKSYLVTLPRSCACVVVTAVAILSYLVPIHCIMMTYMPKKFRCGYVEGYKQFWISEFQWINTTISLFIPFSLICVFTVLIIINLRSNATRRRKMMNVDKASTSDGSTNCFNVQIVKENERSERALTVMMALTAVLFIVLSLPVCVQYIIGTHTISREHLSVLFTLYDLNHVLNFFMYFLTARRFRDRLRLVVCCRREARPSSSANTKHYGETNESSELTTMNTVI